MLEEAVFTRACAFLEEAARLRRLPRYCRGAIARFMLPSAVAAFGGDSPRSALAGKVAHLPTVEASRAALH